MHANDRIQRQASYASETNPQSENTTSRHGKGVIYVIHPTG